MSTTTLPRPRRSRAERYRSALWLLTKRDLRVRYSTSALGYFWSILDPLVMAGIYWFVFVVVFKRDGTIGEDPYIVFLIAGLLPWMWFTGTISDSTRAFLREAKLVRSTSIPRTIWVARLVLSKGLEFLASIPVLIIFAVIFGAHANWSLVWTYPLAIILQAILVLGIGLIVAPLVVFFRDLERAVKLILRFMFYASPIVYSTLDMPKEIQSWAALNPLSGIFALYRSGLYPEQLVAFPVIMSVIISVVVLGIGLLVFRRCERAVLKEI
ncbi:ABC transporter permease [Mycetocola lacteus]|uniref:Transport permease protein n=1 Tax=Mycetocola lacteus TaxID=76637 RepID=A0A3L7AMM7_9MICO|nr:ABC transporter permease [Mycetocola lacteus]RLP80728.1 ABC transporter permease [Mycetocola lacteus]RLP84513.1 ABC transporter permease [Mycetocola lacteus]